MNNSEFKKIKKFLDSNKKFKKIHITVFEKELGLSKIVIIRNISAILENDPSIGQFDVSSGWLFLNKNDKTKNLIHYERILYLMFLFTLFLFFLGMILSSFQIILLAVVPGTISLILTYYIITKRYYGLWVYLPWW